MAENTRMKDLYETLKYHDQNFINTGERMTQIENELNELHQSLAAVNQNLEYLLRKANVTGAGSNGGNGEKAEGSGTERARQETDTPPHIENQTNQQGHNLTAYKVKFPEFNGENPQGWIREANRFFQLNAKENMKKVLHAGYYMVGVADTWYMEYIEGRLDIDWECFCENMLHHFTNPFEKKQREAVAQLDAILDDSSKAEEALDLMAPGENTYILKEILKYGYKNEEAALLLDKLIFNKVKEGLGGRIGGSGIDIRSKARTLPGPVSDPSRLPKWNYEGSSTGQAPGEDSEVMPGQWEFQVGPSAGISASDEIWIARYILVRVMELAGVVLSIDPKPIKGDWNGTGGHTNYNTKSTRKDVGFEMIKKAIEKLGLRHKEHIAAYGEGNEHTLIIYQVHRVRDGKSFATRRMEAIQKGNVVFTIVASFQKEEDNLLLTTYGRLQPLFGTHRLKVAEFIAVLVAVSNGIVERASFGSNSPAIRPLIPPGFRNNVLDKTSGLTSLIPHLSEVEKLETGENLKDTESRLQNNNHEGLEWQLSQNTSLVDGQLSEKTHHTSLLSEWQNFSLQKDFNVPIRKLSMVDQNIVGVDASAIGDNSVADSNKSSSTSIFEKIFGNTSSASGSGFSSAELQDSKPDDIQSLKPVKSSKFALWFSEEGSKAPNDTSFERLVDFSLGTDTGVSVKVPGSCCGIYGFRPSHGVVSTVGVIPIAQSIDNFGSSSQVIIADDCFKLLNNCDGVKEVLIQAVEKLYGSQIVLVYEYRYPDFGRSAEDPFITTSYDYDAPFDEYGLIRQLKYGHLKELHRAIKQYEKAWVSADPTLISLENFQQARDFTSKSGECAASLSNYVWDPGGGQSCAKKFSG